MASILVVDDEPKMRHILRIMLELRGHGVTEAEDGAQALETLEDRPFDLVISDIKMPRMDGLTLLERIQSMEAPVPVVFITAFATVDSAVKAMQKGAVDYITKPFEEERIALTVEKALGISRIMTENKELKEKLEARDSGEIICVSRAMRKLLDVASKVAKKADTTVLITGESGTGKEVLARFIHENSPRAKGRFVAVNCAAITPTLIESTLFGHERGAFTGADRRKEGLFEYAQSGSIFLDEIGEMPLEVQANLLRALQEKVIQRVGGNKPIEIDVRVICATNRDLEAEVKAGRFRQDLFYRINVFPLHIPPLRQRKEAIEALAEHFVRKFREKECSGPCLTQGAKRVLMGHTWPGNVRELANAMERAVILAGEGPITTDHLAFLRPQDAKGRIQSMWELPPDGISLEALEKDLIRQALIMTNNNQSAAARLLGLTRSKLRTRVKQLEEGD